MMITKNKIKELQKRMLNHQVDGDTAVVEVTARELQDLLDTIEILSSRQEADYNF